MQRVLITGAAGWTGGHLARRLEEDGDLEILGVDDREPKVQFDSHFEQLPLDRLTLAQYVLDVEPNIVFHLHSVHPRSVQGQSEDAEERIVGSLALFGALERLKTVQKVIVKSDTAFYGASARNPSVLSESARPHGSPSRYERNLREMEQFIGDTAGRYPNMSVTVLRFAPIFGPSVGNPISMFLQMRAVPTMLGFDPRMQFIHETDAVSALVHAGNVGVPGTFNVAPEGQIFLSRVLRLGRRVAQPLPSKLFDKALTMLQRANIVIPDDLRGLLKFGRVTNTSAMANTFGFAPAFSQRGIALDVYGRNPETMA